MLNNCAQFLYLPPCKIIVSRKSNLRTKVHLAILVLAVFACTQRQRYLQSSF